MQNELPEALDNTLHLVPGVVSEGQAVTLTGAFNDGGPITTHVVSVNWGDGTTSPATINPLTRTFSATHVYRDDGSSGSAEDAYGIQVTVIDPSDAEDTSTYGLVLATVRNVAPSNLQVNLSSASISENQSVSLNGSFVDPGILDTHTLRIDWGDGSPRTEVLLGVGVTTFGGISHTYLDDPRTGPDAFSITIEVVDDDEPAVAIQVIRNLPVGNVPPSNIVPVASSLLLSEGGTLTLGASFADPGTLNAHRVTINWGDGSLPAQFDLSAGELSFAGVQHVYADNRPFYNVTIHVQDDDGASASTFSMLPIQVTNLAPVLGTLSLSRSAINEGESVTLSGSYTDEGIEDTHLVFINWGDGTISPPTRPNATSRTFSATHTYHDDGVPGTPFDQYLISVQLVDKDGGPDTETASVVVANVAPTAVILPEEGTTVDTVRLRTVAVDPGSLDMLTYTWTVVSSNPAILPNPVFGIGPTFTFNRNGDHTATYAITLRVQDNDGGQVLLNESLLVLSQANDTFVSQPQPTGTGRVIILGLNGDDHIDVSNWNIPVTLDGGAGNDTLIGSSAADTIILRQGNDTGFGGPGADGYLVGFNSTHTIDDFVGANTLDFSFTTFGVSFDLETAMRVEGELQDVDPAHPGTHFADFDGVFTNLTGTSAADTLTGATGATLFGASGADQFRVKAGTANARFFGGADLDVFSTFGLPGTITGVTFSGDDGADKFTNIGGMTLAGTIVFTGGADEDVFENFGTITGGISFSGDDGADLFTTAVGSVISGGLTFAGGADVDVFTNFGSLGGGISFSGDDGADVFTNQPGGTVLGSITFTAGADDDVFTNLGSAGAITFSGDDGADTFTSTTGSLAGGLIDFSGGAG